MLRHSIVTGLQNLAQKTDATRSTEGSGRVRNFTPRGRDHALGVEYEGGVQRQNDGSFSLVNVEKGKTNIIVDYTELGFSGAALGGNKNEAKRGHVGLEGQATIWC